MRYQNWLRGGFWLAVVGACGFLFPFVWGAGVFEDLSANGLSLMLGVGELRFNIWLWLTLVAVVVCLCYNSQARGEQATRRPDKADRSALVSALAAGLGVVFLLLFRENLASDYGKGHFMLETQWGWSVAVWCCVGAALCVIGAYVTGGSALEEEGGQTP